MMETIRIKVVVIGDGSVGWCSARADTGMGSYVIINISNNII